VLRPRRPRQQGGLRFATANLAAGIAGDERYLQIMAAVMAAGMVPPLAMALASTVIDRKLFTEPERENGKAAWLLGAAFISEGAIPFAAADIFRVIPAMMLGGAVTGALSMAFAVTSKAPHGGVFVFFAIDNFWLWLLAIAAGTVVAAFAVVALKRFARRRPVETVSRACSGFSRSRDRLVSKRRSTHHPGGSHGRTPGHRRQQLGPARPPREALRAGGAADRRPRDHRGRGRS
jgi:hypothetical protein